MKNKKAGIVIGILVLVAAVAAFFMLKKKPTTTTNTTNTTPGTGSGTTGNGLFGITLGPDFGTNFAAVVGAFGHGNPVEQSGTPTPRAAAAV